MWITKFAKTWSHIWTSKNTFIVLLFSSVVPAVLIAQTTNCTGCTWMHMHSPKISTLSVKAVCVHSPGINMAAQAVRVQNLTQLAGQRNGTNPVIVFTAFYISVRLRWCANKQFDWEAVFTQGCNCKTSLCAIYTFAWSEFPKMPFQCFREASPLSSLKVHILIAFLTDWRQF